MKYPRPTVVMPGEFKPLSDEAHFAPARWAGTTLFISGQTGINEAGDRPESPGAEARVAFTRIRQIVEFAGLTLNDVVSITTYHVGDASDIHGWFGPVRDEFFGEPWPCWTAIGVASLGDVNARLEISAVAYDPAESGEES